MAEGGVFYFAACFEPKFIGLNAFKISAGHILNADCIDSRFAVTFTLQLCELWKDNICSSSPAVA